MIIHIYTNKRELIELTLLSLTVHKVKSNTLPC